MQSRDQTWLPASESVPSMSFNQEEEDEVAVEIDFVDERMSEVVNTDELRENHGPSASVLTAAFGEDNDFDRRLEEGVQAHRTVQRGDSDSDFGSDESGDVVKDLAQENEIFD